MKHDKKDKKDKRKNSRQFNNKFKKRFFTKKSAIVWLLTLVIFIILVIGYRNIEQKVASYQETIDELSSEIKELEEDNASLEKEMKDISSDDYIEKMARERLGMVKKDEYTLKQSDQSSDSNN